MALLPPPPTPITLMTFDWFLGKSNEMFPNENLENSHENDINYEIEN